MAARALNAAASVHQREREMRLRRALLVAYRSLHLLKAKTENQGK